MTDQDKCDSATWLFVGSGSTAAVELIKLGQIGEEAKAKSDRLSVTANCSLVIKKVTVEDVGAYTCRQFKSGQQQGQDSQVDLSVVTMTEHKDTDKVTLNCSVSTYGQCEQTVKWVYEGNDWDVNTQHLKESQSSCFATVMFTTSHLAETSKYSELFKCNVTDKNTGKVQQFAFSPQSTGEDTKRAATTKSTPVKSTKTTKLPTTTSTTATMGKSTKTTMNQTAPTTIDTPTKQQDFPDWAKFIIVAVGLASLLIIVLVIIIWKKTKGTKTQMDENKGLNINPAVTPGTSQHRADPEDGVPYASISYTKKTNSKARVCGDGDDEGDAVTYSTVKYSSSSTEASTDPSDLYATVNKPNK
ncbi:uncharacterized protein [Thunnus thynnus]|uniref:uncharacterized protein n=1 Tax=Thunnus thynnus TaxID=8237 RepID=UPI003527472B